MVILSRALRMQAELRAARYARDIYLSNASELDLLDPVELPIIMSESLPVVSPSTPSRIRVSQGCSGTCLTLPASPCALAGTRKIPTPA